MLSQFTIGHVRSFSAPQTLQFARPNGTSGSGYNLIVGKNNSGKSTIIKIMRDLLSGHDAITVGQEARHDPARPDLSLTWVVNSDPETVSIDASGSGGLFRKTGNYRGLERQVRYIPSRRPFSSQFNPTHQINPSEYERQDYVHRRTQPSYFDAMLSSSLARILTDQSSATHLLTLLRTIDSRFTGIDADNVGSQDVIRFLSSSGRWHVISDTGDGLINLVRILHAVATSKPDESIIIDEPELSLHPQLQRTLYELLYDISGSRQLIMVTHSPHFVTWKHFASAGQLFKLHLDEHGWSQVRTAPRERLAEVAKAADANITNRKYFDAVSKEIFFADEAVLVEGPDDVHYISNYLDTKSAKPLPLMGYGCGGASAITCWMRLCCDLGIRTAAIFDADRRDDFNKSISEFTTECSPVTSFMISRDDIRDKYVRDKEGRETKELSKKGIFRRDGSIHEDARITFELLLASVSQHLRGAAEA